MRDKREARVVQMDAMRTSQQAQMLASNPLFQNGHLDQRDEILEELVLTNPGSPEEQMAVAKLRVVIDMWSRLDRIVMKEEFIAEEAKIDNGESQ